MPTLLCVYYFGIFTFRGLHTGLRRVGSVGHSVPCTNCSLLLRWSAAVEEWLAAVGAHSLGLLLGQQGTSGVIGGWVDSVVTQEVHALTLVCLLPLPGAAGGNARLVKS